MVTLHRCRFNGCLATLLVASFSAAASTSCRGEPAASDAPVTVQSDPLHPTLFQDDFKSGKLDDKIYVPVNAKLKIAHGVLDVVPTAPNGGVLIMNPLDERSLSSSRPDSAWSYSVQFQPVAANPNDGTITITSQGLAGSTIDSTKYDYATGIATTTERDAFGQLTTSPDAFSRDQARGHQRRRNYSWWPPVCAGPTCSYGIGNDGYGNIVIFARWTLGAARTSIGAPDAAPVLGGVELMASMPFRISLVSIEAGPTLESDASSVWYLSADRAPVSGGASLELHGKGFLTMGPFQVTVGGQLAKTAVIDEHKVSVVIPPGPKGPASVVLSTADTKLHVELADFRYYAGKEPLTIDAVTLPRSKVGKPYSAKIGASGGTGTVQFSLASGKPPDGITLSTGGALSGPPTSKGIYTFYVAAHDTLDNEDVHVFFLEAD